MEKNIKNLENFQEEIFKAIKEEEISKISFKCPRCDVEISEELFGEDGKKFRLLIDKCMEVARKKWLKEIEITKEYEKFTGFANLQKQLNEKEGIIKGFIKNLQDEKLKHAEELSKKTSYDEIRKLDWFKKQEEELIGCRKDIENLKVQEQKNIGKYKEELLAKELEYTNKLVVKQKELDKATSDDVIKGTNLYKELKGELDRYKEDNKKFNHPDYVESTKRVKDLETEKKQLISQIQELRDKGRMSKKKGENFEQYVLEELNRVFDNKDRIRKITHLGGKADFLQEVLTEDGELAGRIIYEAKDGKSWKSEWENKLENDMANEKADFGIIIATCENGKSLRCLDPRKKIYVSDDEKFVHFAKIMRDSLIKMYNNLKKNDMDDEGKEKRIKNFEEWVGNKFPQYLSRLERELTGLKESSYHADKINEITRNAEVNIRRIIFEEVRIEINSL